jgi:hypothetical protein
MSQAGFFIERGYMKYYVEAYRSDGSQVLGNLDGQAVIRARDYKRTNIYKRLKSEPKSKLSLGGKVVRYDIVRANPMDPNSRNVVETIRKD